MKNINLNQIQNTRNYKMLNLVVFIGIITVLIINALFSSKLTKSISTNKQQAQTTQINQDAIKDQESFYLQNKEMISVVDQALPSQSGIISMIERVESLIEEKKISGSFGFTSMVPSQESNQYFIPFNIRLTTNVISLIDFMRRFEKLPYLTSINSINIKTPNGIGGIYEVSILGKVYVQDLFKN